MYILAEEFFLPPFFMSMLRESFITYLKVEKQVSAHTLTAYLTDLDKCAEFLHQRGRDLFDPQQVCDIHHRELRAWLGSLRKEGLSSRSAGRHLSSVKTYFKYLRNSQHIEQNPAAKLSLPRNTHQLPVFLKEADTERLFTSDLFSQSFRGKRDQCLMELLYGCGLRRDELIHLSHAGVDLSKRQLKVLGKRNKERIIPFGKYVEAAIKEYLREKEEAGLVLTGKLLVRENGEALYPKLVYRVVQKYLMQAASVSKNSPHVLRHTFATHLLDRGADINAIKEMLGHESLAATQVYTHTSIEKLKEMHNQAHPRAQKDSSERES